MTSTADRLVDDYLKRLNRELADLPRGRRSAPGSACGLAGQGPSRSLRWSVS